MSNQEIFIELSLVLVIVSLVAGLMRLLRQPLILGYILTGILVGPSFLDVIKAHEAFDGFSQIGIALLLFIVGLGLNADVIQKLGRLAVTTSLSVSVVLGTLSFGLARLLGFDVQQAVIMAVALLFSSTIIIIKMLSDKRETSRLYGQIAISILLIEDIVATIAILIISTIGHHQALTPLSVGWLAVKGAGLALGLYIVGGRLLPMIVRRFARTQELLFLFAVSWGFGISALFSLAGFSYEVGALFAGVALAGLPYATEMGTRLKPLRDFFVVLFFVTLGESLQLQHPLLVIGPALLLSVLVIMGKPLLVLTMLSIERHTKLTAFRTAIHLSQMSEFSIILILLATQLSLVEQRVTSIMTLVALISIGVSSYLMKYDQGIYRTFEKKLSFFERKNAHEHNQRHDLYSALLFGYHHGGHEFLELFREMHIRYLVVDYNPEIIEHLELQGVRHAYGDATDGEFLEEINAGKAQFVASTIMDLDVNKLLLGYLHRFSPDIVFICHAQTYEDALELYDHGATYVILPRFLGNEYITSHIKRYGMGQEAFTHFRQKHIISIGKKAVENA